MILNIKTLIACFLLVFNFLIGVLAVPIIIASLVPEQWTTNFFINLLLIVAGSLILNLLTVILQNIAEQRMSVFKTKTPLMIRNGHIQRIADIVTKRDVISFILFSFFSWFLAFTFIRRAYQKKTSKELRGIMYYKNLCYATIINNVGYSAFNYYWAVPFSYFLLKAISFLE